MSDNALNRWLSRNARIRGPLFLDKASREPFSAALTINYFHVRNRRNGYDDYAHRIQAHGPLAPEMVAIPAHQIHRDSEEALAR